MREQTSGDSSPADDENLPKGDFIGEKLSDKKVGQLVLNTGEYFIRLVDATKTEKNERYFNYLINL